MKTAYIAFDLATTTTGVALIFENNKGEQTPFCFELNFGGWELIVKNKFGLIELNNFIGSLLLYSAKGGYTTINVVIELSNFSNPELTQRFSLLTGIIIQIFNDKFKNQFNLNFKVVNSNSWFGIVYNLLETQETKQKQPWTHLNREQRKQWAITMSNDLINNDPDIALSNQLDGLEHYTKKSRPTTDNEADALLMGLYYYQLTDTYNQREIKRTQKQLIKGIKRKCKK